MKTSILIFLASIATGFAQGPLTPPGAPAPTMKTLDQVEARTPIETLPYIISTSGSYYFTKNLQFTASSGNAITITTNNVTLDLNGFTLSSTSGVTGTAILVNDNLNNIAIKNGNIAGNTTVTITGSPPTQTWSTSAAGFAHGIYAYAFSSRNMAIDQIQTSGCRFDGFVVVFGSVSNSRAASNGNFGISASYCSVTNSAASSNANFGIEAYSGSVSNSTASSNGGAGISANSGSVTNSTASSNGNIGIYAYSGNVTNSTASSNVGAGINADVGSVANSTAISNVGTGISASPGSVSNSTASSNGGTGIYAYNGSVTASTAISNKYSGIYAETGSVTSCVARFNNTANAAFGFDLYAPYAVIAFTKYGTGYTTGSTLTGNQTP